MTELLEITTLGGQIEGALQLVREATGIRRELGDQVSVARATCGIQWRSRWPN